MERLQKTKRDSSKETAPEEETPTAKKDAKVEEDKAAADALLDEIDSLLEANAETFVKEYVQRGGE